MIKPMIGKTVEYISFVNYIVNMTSFTTYNKIFNNSLGFHLLFYFLTNIRVFEIKNKYSFIYIRIKIFVMDYTKLKGKIPQKVYDELPMVIEKYKINTVNRLAHFLGQCSHESAGFTAVRENLNYSAQGLANTFPTRFAVDPKAKVKTPNQLALSVQRKPEDIANIVYANRMGNGSADTNEPFIFSGKGFLQTTGKINFQQFDNEVVDDIMKNPDLVATKYPLLSAGFFWFKNNLNTLADGGVNNATITSVTRRVNGGVNGLNDRVEKTKYYFNLLK
jgi:putative chitinase